MSSDPNSQRIERVVHVATGAGRVLLHLVVCAMGMLAFWLNAAP